VCSEEVILLFMYWQGAVYLNVFIIIIIITTIIIITVFINTTKSCVTVNSYLFKMSAVVNQNLQVIQYACHLKYSFDVHIHVNV
jgi:hypothetical protein